MIRLSSTRTSNCADPSPYPQPVQQQTASSCSSSSSSSCSSSTNCTLQLTYTIIYEAVNVILYFEQNIISELECDLIRWPHSALTVHAGYSLRQSFWSWPSLAACTYRWNRTDAEFRTAVFTNSWGSLQQQRATVTHTQVHSLWDQAIGKEFSFILQGRDVVPPSVPLRTIRGLIPQSLQLQALVCLASLG